VFWRDLSRLARAAVVVTALALTLAIAMVITAGAGAFDASFAAFYYCMFAAFASLCVWAVVGIRWLVRLSRRAR
jgi:hypothetical protein